MKDLLRRWFVPHKDNDYHPDALQKTAFAGMVMMALLSFSVANIQSILWMGSDWLVSTVLPAVVAEETNIARADSGYSTLERNPLLDKVAQLKAEDMASEGYFAHWSPDGVSPWYWFEKAGYKYSHAGENLAVHFTDSSAVVNAWLRSPTHRANIMNKAYTEIGIGTAQGTYEGYDTVFVVQMFGAPSNEVNEIPTRKGTDNEGEAPSSLDNPDVAGVSDVSQADLTDEGTMVLSSFASTEGEDVSGAASLSTAPSWWERLATSPRLILQIVYSLLGLFVAVALTVSLILEWRHHHPAQMAYSLSLLLIMIVLFQLHINLTQGVVIA